MTAAIAAGMQAGFLNPIVGQEYQLPHASEAHRDIIEGKGAKGKVVLVPWSITEGEGSRRPTVRLLHVQLVKIIQSFP